ncbi:MAG: glycosyltransferase [Chloroflexota bacterium]
MLENQDIVCIAPNPWDQTWMRRQQLMSRFAVGNRVLYVEPANLLLSALLSRKGLARLLNGALFLHRDRKHPFILSQYRLLPFEETSLHKGVDLVKKINDWFCVTMLQRALKRLDFNRPILWLYYTPRREGFIGKCHEKLVVCDVFDRYSAYPYNASDPWLKDLTDREDANLIGKADIVFASSEPLFSYCREFNQRVYLVLNGTDTSLLNQTPTAPEDMAHIQHPVLGYVGAIFDKLDFEILSHTAEKHPEWTILMIGPSNTTSDEAGKLLSTLRGKKNVLFLGSKLQAQLPGYYEAIDVALMPYKLDEHTDHIFPLKMFEYMAFRKPIVSTDIPAARQFADVISIAHTREQFIDSVSMSLSNDNSQRTQWGFEIAQQNSWDKRVEELSQVIQARLYDKTIAH